MLHIMDSVLKITHLLLMSYIYTYKIIRVRQRMSNYGCLLNMHVYLSKGREVCEKRFTDNVSSKLFWDPLFLPRPIDLKTICWVICVQDIMCKSHGAGYPEADPYYYSQMAKPVNPWVETTVTIYIVVHDYNERTSKTYYIKIWG